MRERHNAIGEHGGGIRQARFVPPPPGPELIAALNAFEKFLHEPSPLPLLVRLALVHYQFETIHPFLDCNGRVGRILISLLLCANERLSQPLLYMSAYFERHRDAYVDHLLHISQNGDWGPWISFFVAGVIEQCGDAHSRARRLFELRDAYREKLSRATGLVHKLIDDLCRMPAVTVPKAVKLLGVTNRAASLIIQKLVDAKILVQIEGTWPHVFIAQELIDVIEGPLMAAPGPTAVGRPGTPKA